MAYFKATIEVLVDVEDEASACDAIAETIRPLLREFAGAQSCWIDWHYAGSNMVPVPDSGLDFEYA